MKELKDIVVSPDLASELNKRGVVKEGLFGSPIEAPFDMVDNVHSLAEQGAYYIIRPTTDELLEIFPKTQGLQITHDVYGYEVEWGDYGWYECDHLEAGHESTMCNALAKMLIWLDDNKLLEKK